MSHKVEAVNRQDGKGRDPRNPQEAKRGGKKKRVGQKGIEGGGGDEKCGQNPGPLIARPFSPPREHSSILRP